MLTVDDVNFKDFVVSFMDIPTSKECFTPGFCNSIFGNEDLSFRVLALRVKTFRLGPLVLFISLHLHSFFH